MISAIQHNLIIQGALIFFAGIILISVIIFLKKDDNSTQNIINFLKNFKRSQNDRVREKLILNSVAQKQIKELQDQVDRLNEEIKKMSKK